MVNFEEIEMNKKRLITIFIFIISGNALFSQKYFNINQPYIDSEQQIFAPIVWRTKTSTEAFISLVEKCDSVIFEDVEFRTKRKYFDIKLGLKYFDVDINEVLLIFNSKNQLIGKAKFKNFEYYEGTIESQFYAHYKLIGKKSDLSDCTFSLYESNKKFINDSLKLISSNINEFKSMRNYKDKEFITSDYKGYSIQGKDFILALINYASASLKEGENLYETKLILKSGNTEEVILNLTDSYILSKVFVVPILKNNRPILLFEINTPDTDYLDIMCAEYDNGYKLTERKIKIE